MTEDEFKRLYQGEFPPFIDDARQAHDLLAEKLSGQTTQQLTGCTSYIQRKLQCGYNHASALMDFMEDEGWITEADSKGARRLRSRT